MNEAIQFEIAKLELKPGDTLVFKHPPGLRPEVMDRIRTTLSTFLRGNHPGVGLIFLPKDFELQKLEGAKPLGGTDIIDAPSSPE